MNWIKIRVILGCLMFFGVILGSLIVHFKQIDDLYVNCIEEKAKAICAKQEKQMAQFSAWQPYVKCITIESTNMSSMMLIIPYMDTKEDFLYIFNETEIQTCWAIAKN